MTKTHPTPATWVSYAEAFRMFLRGSTFPTAARISVVVGTWYSFINQGELILDGRPPWLKIAANYVTPFVVSSLGYLAARRRRNVEQLIALVCQDEDQPMRGGVAR